MSTQVGLLDHLINHGDLKNVRFICLDELDKMPKRYQYGILNALESGIMKETKFRRSREVNLKDVTFFATANYFDKIIEPLQTRFLTVEIPPYTNEEFNQISFKLLTQKYKVNLDLAETIINVINKNIPNKSIRTVVQFATLVNNHADINDMLDLFR